jgi:hypothetical protein
MLITGTRALTFQNFFGGGGRREMASTSLQEDQELMHAMLHQPLDFESSTCVNAQLLSAINYRMERKRLLEKAIAILRGYLAVLGVPT